MYMYKCLCDRCEKCTETKSLGIPPGWFSVLAYSKNNHRETIYGNSEERRHICPECIAAELQSLVVDTIAHPDLDFVQIDLRREPLPDETPAT